MWLQLTLVRKDVEVYVNMDRILTIGPWKAGSRLVVSPKSVYGNWGYRVVRLEAWHENPILQT